MPDPLGIYVPFPIETEFLLKKLKAMRRAWDNELTADHFKLFSGLCTELRHMRFISIKRLYPKNLYTNLSLHNLTDGSKEATCILTYLEDQITLKLIYGRCRVASITDTKVSKLKTPSRSLRSWPPKSNRENLTRNQKIVLLKTFLNSTAIDAVSSQKVTRVCCQQAAGILENSPMDQWRHVRGIKNPACINTQRMSIGGFRVLKQICMAPD